MTKSDFERTGWHKGIKVIWDKKSVTVLRVDFDDEMILILHDEVAHWVTYRYIEIINQ